MKSSKLDNQLTEEVGFSGIQLGDPHVGVGTQMAFTLTEPDKATEGAVEVKRCGGFPGGSAERICLPMQETRIPSPGSGRSHSAVEHVSPEHHNY